MDIPLCIVLTGNVPFTQGGVRYHLVVRYELCCHSCHDTRVSVQEPTSELGASSKPTG